METLDFSWELFSNFSKTFQSLIFLAFKFIFFQLQVSREIHLENFLVFSVGTVLAKEGNAHMVRDVLARIYILVNKICYSLAEEKSRRSKTD